MNTPLRRLRGEAERWRVWADEVRQLAEGVTGDVVWEERHKGIAHGLELAASELEALLNELEASRRAE